MRRWRSLKLHILNGYTMIEIEVLLAILLNVKMSSTLRSDDSECYEYMVVIDRSLITFIKKTYQTIFTGGKVMAKALYISSFGEGHVNPTLGLVNDLVKRGEHIAIIHPMTLRRKLKKQVLSFALLTKGHRENFKKVVIFYTPSRENICYNF